MTDSERRLLSLVLQDSRSGARYFGEQLSKSRNWVTRTLRKFVRDGIIRSYTTIINPLQAYSERSTILLVKTNPRELDVSRSLLEIPGLESLDGISGEYSLQGLFRFRSAEAFERFLNLLDSTIVRSSSKTYKLVQVLTTYKTHGFIVDSAMNDGIHLSPRDWSLLEVIRRHAPSLDRPFPLSQAEIGQRMNPPLRQSAVSKALSRLEASQTILGYSADLKFYHFGLPIKFFLEIKAAPGAIGTTARAIAQLNEVWDLHRIGESFSLFATVRCVDIDHYNRFLRNLYRNENVIDTRSQISLEDWFIPV